MWIECPPDLAAGRMEDSYRLGRGGDGQNWAEKGSGTARADSCISTLEYDHGPTNASSAEYLLTMSSGCSNTLPKNWLNERPQVKTSMMFARPATRELGLKRQGQDQVSRQYFKVHIESEYL